jgi:glycosyltransferase involved in cell wall biosynthesis
MDQDIIFSIIIPHKNTPDLLQRCLDSIPRCANIQIIVVDDNSDPTKVDFTHFPALDDSCVEVYLTKEGKGAGFARNIGLCHAKGAWLIFADADEFFTQNAFDTLFEYKDSCHDILYFKVTSCYSDTLEEAGRDQAINPFVDDYINGMKVAEDFIRYRHIVPWGKMIKRNLITRGNILFDEVVASNDRMFSICAGHLASSVSIIDKALYCTTITKGSIGHTISIQNLTSKYMVLLRCNDFVRKAGKGHCQYSILPDLYLSTKYGIHIFIKFIKLAIQYKSNPFIRIGHILLGTFAFFKSKRKDKKYMIEK